LLRFGNRSTQEIASILISKKEIIQRFLSDSQIGALEIHL